MNLYESIKNEVKTKLNDTQEYKLTEEDEDSYLKGIEILDNVFNNPEREDLWERKFNELVPKTGNAKTPIGEVMRCFSSLSNAYYQNGDIMSKLYSHGQMGYYTDAYDLTKAVKELNDTKLINLVSKMWSTRRDSAYAKYMAIFYEYFTDTYVKEEIKELEDKLKKKGIKEATVNFTKEVVDKYQGSQMYSDDLSDEEAINKYIEEHPDLNLTPEDCKVNVYEKPITVSDSLPKEGTPNVVDDFKGYLDSNNIDTDKVDENVINDYFTERFYNIEDEQDLDQVNSDEVLIRSIFLDESTDSDLKEGAHIQDFYTGFDAPAFVRYIEQHLSKHLLPSSIYNNNPHEFEIFIYDRASNNSYRNYSVANIKLDKETKEIEVELFTYGDNDRDVDYETFTTSDIDEALNKINNFQYDKEKLLRWKES